MRFYVLAPAIGAALLVGASSLTAQGTCTTTPACTVTNTASATVITVARLTLSANNTDLGTPTEADYIAGHKDAAGPVATVEANTAWHVAVVGNTGTFSCGGTGCWATKPASDLLWGTVAGTYGNTTATSATLFSGSGTASSTQQSFYETKWSFVNDTPGTYTMVVNYTLSEP